jgi:hypothetical protein
MFLATPPRRRNLVLNHAKRVVDYNTSLSSSSSPVEAISLSLQTPLTSYANEEPGREDQVMSAGEEMLLSYFQPSLQAGVYSTVITHDIKIKDDGGDGTNNKLELKSAQDFRVVGSRFALEKGDIAGFYPPQGHGDYNHILPHIIFNDQYLPWLRSGTKSNASETAAIPWLALLVFTAEELTLQPSEEILPPKKEQDSAGGTVMTFKEIFAAQKENKVVSPFSENDPEKIDGEMSAKFVFVPQNVFGSLFCKYNQDGSPIQLNDGDTPDTSRYQYLAHCRKMNTEGMSEQIVTENGQQLFSIVVSHRTAPVDFTETTSVCVHLVSIENIENVKSNPSGKRVAMCTLHSWTYNVFPTGTPTLQDRMKSLGDTRSILRPPPSVIDSLGKDSSMPPNILSRLKARAQSGYTLVRYRVSTGEQTIAFTRSPFVPGQVIYPIPNLPPQSLTSGTDLQILDQPLGIMDITYASAWQLGKSLALADRTFTTALVRMRTQLAKQGGKLARQELVKRHGFYLTLEDTIASLTSSLDEIFALPKKAARTDAPSQLSDRSTKPLLDLSMANPELYALFDHHCSKVISTLSAAVDGTMFAEHNTAVSADWQRVFSFVLNCLYLYDIPPHYLLPDPALLPAESLCFFTIDKNWIDALIDGALSLANNQLPEADKVTRNKIREKIQEYLDEVDPALGYKPQVPTYGMLLRSDIVSRFPGLSIRAPNLNPADLRAPILRQTVIAEGTLLVLFDRVPGSEELPSLTIQMPPHEQRFSVGKTINALGLQIDWKCIYTHKAPEAPYPKLKTSMYKPPAVPSAEETETVAVYDWPSRTLNMHTYTSTAFNYLKTLMPPETFTEVATTSVIAGIQLNDPLYEMSIQIDPGHRNILGLGEDYCPISIAFGSQSNQLFSLKPRPLFLKPQSPSIELQLPSREIQLPSSKPQVMPAEEAQDLSSTEPQPFSVESLLLSLESRLLSPKPSTTPALSESLSNLMPRYNYGIWPVFKIPTKKPADGKYLIPRDLPYTIDIVFSIIRKDDWSKLPPKNLTKIEVVLSLVPETALIASYEGPGGYLASNMRWTYALFEHTRKEKLRVGILPRDNTKNSSPIADNKELTFVLRECRITNLNVAYYALVKEYYEGQEEPIVIPVHYKLVHSSK